MRTNYAGIWSQIKRSSSIQTHKQNGSHERTSRAPFEVACWRNLPSAQQAPPWNRSRSSFALPLPKAQFRCQAASARQRIETRKNIQTNTTESQSMHISRTLAFISGPRKFFTSKGSVTRVRCGIICPFFITTTYKTQQHEKSNKDQCHRQESSHSHTLNFSKCVGV